MPDPNQPLNQPSGERQHLKFNRDVLPEFRRRTDVVEGAYDSRGREVSVEETDSIFKWIGVGILVLVVGGIIGVTMYNRVKADKEASQKEEPTAVELVNGEREQVKEVVREYMATSTVEARMNFVRRPEEVRVLMERYYARNELYPLRVWNYEVVEPRSIDSWPFWYAVVNTPEGREILLVEQVGKTFKVDWETHVGLNPMLPEDYLNERPEEEMDFRVYVTPDAYYNEPFGSSDEFLSVKLEFANSGVVVFGYLEKKSPDLTRFLELVDGGEQVPLILALQWPAGAMDRSKDLNLLPQVSIKKLVSERWVVIESAATTLEQEKAAEENE